MGYLRELALSSRDGGGRLAFQGVEAFAQFTMYAPLEISAAPSWYGLRPSIPRAEALRVIEAAGAEFSEDANDPGWMLVRAETWALELRFAESGEEYLRQISVDAEDVLWMGRPVVGVPVHAAVEAIGADARGAGWRPEDGVAEAFNDLGTLGSQSFTDEQLLDSGTLWLPKRALGLGMREGHVSRIIWRRPDDVPREFSGPFTEAQRQISHRADLAEYLRRSSSISAVAASKPMNWAQRALTFLLVIVFVYLGREAWRETQRWQTAATVTGHLVQIEKATRKPWIDRYRIKYRDPAGRMKEAIVEAGEFYVAPRETGEETQLSYVDGNPPEVRGPAHGRDAAFVKYAPQFIGVLVVYATVMFIAGRLRLKRPQAETHPTLPVPPGSST